MSELTDPRTIRAFHICAAISAIKLEKLGMRHSSGRSVKAMWAKRLGLSVRTRHDVVIAKLREHCDAILAGREQNVPSRERTNGNGAG